MMKLTNPLVIALAIGLTASAATAQDTAAPAADTATPAAETPAADAPAAAPEAPAADTAAPAAEAPAADGPGTTYIAETIGDWGIQCVRTESGNDPCQMYQLLKDADGNSVADISMFALPKGGKAVAGATIMTPLETLLTQNVVLKVDSSEPRVYPFTFCAQVGCFSRIGLTAEELAAYKKGNKVQLTVVPMVAPDKKVQLDISLKGFTAAYDKVAEMNADNQ